MKSISSSRSSLVTEPNELSYSEPELSKLDVGSESVSEDMSEAMESDLQMQVEKVSQMMSLEGAIPSYPAKCRF